jgi:hypothetical protein
MKKTAVDCAEIRSNFLAGRVPEGAAVSAHLEGCAACRELFESDARLGRALSLGAVAAPAAEQLLERVSSELEREAGLRARVRALPSTTRLVALVGLALALAGYQLLINRRVDFASYSPAVFWSVACVLVASLGWGGWVLLRGTLVPLGARRARWAPLLLLLPALLALLAPLGAKPEVGALGDGAGACFGYGAALVVPVLILLWLSERRDSVPLSAVVLAGAVAGLSANLLLHAHCASAELGHLLGGHASIGVAWSVALALLSGRLQR